MLDKEQFDKEGKTPDEIVQEAISGPLLNDFTKESDRRLLEDLTKYASGKPIITDAHMEFIDLSTDKFMSNA